MRIAICDDSSIDRELIHTMLHQYFAQHTLRPEFVLYESGVNLICDIQEDTWFDIIFLDIYMNKLLGIDAARRLRELGYAGSIIFLTASADFAVDSYDVQASGYLLKPLGHDKLRQVMDRVLQGMDASAYSIKQRSRVIRVPYHEILFVESSNSKCILHRNEGSYYTIYKRLDEIQHELADPRFLRCHQSYLVNMDFILQADKQFLLTTGDTVLIRQRDQKAIRQSYLDYAAGKSN